MTVLNAMSCRMYNCLTRRRSLVLKALLLMTTAWLTVAFLIFIEDKKVLIGDSIDSQQQQRNGPAIGEPALAELQRAGQVIRAAELDYLKAEAAAAGSAVEQEDNKRGEDYRDEEVKSENAGKNSLPSNEDERKQDEELPGEFGKPVTLPSNMTPEIKKLVDDGWQKNAFNQYVSDLISLHRKLPDPRDQWCKVPGRYLTDLPQTSVVICFHNEAWSVLLRTVHSVLDRSPDHLLKEILLVDDFSDMPHLKLQLEEYMEMYPKVRIIRAPKREGLIRARLIGAKYAKAPVLTYLDSHCECAVGWLEPLLDRIARDPTTVVCPVIDVIDDNTLEYHWRDSGGVNVGGFDWNLQFTWHPVPKIEKLRHNNSAEPVHSPTMAGGLFSIDKAFFEKLGTYDSGFDIWGGENLELSFKTWMCGGTLEIVPCSHVGHIFRKRSPYKWRTGVNVLKRNSIRLAQVWMDDYAKYYYQRIGNDLGDYGDVSSRTQLREKLGCKSFKWYLSNVYPDLFIPGDAVANGEVRNLAGEWNMCLDSPSRKSDLHKPVGLYQCHKMGGNQIANIWSELCIDSSCKPEDMHKPIGLWPCHKQGGNQYWMLSKHGEIRRDEACLDYSGGDVILYPCHGSQGNQYWEYNEKDKLIQHGSSKKCLAVSENRQKLKMEVCNSHVQRQLWNFENFNSSKLISPA